MTKDLLVLESRSDAQNHEEHTDYSIVLAGHGSRDNDGVQEFEEFVALVQERDPKRTIDYGYLEFAKPTIYEAVQKNISAGSKKIVVVPVLLAAATHAKNDMPGELHALQQEFPDIEFFFGAAMDLHPQLLKLCRERIVAAEATSQVVMKRSDVCLVVVGRGTSDPDANADISKLARMLEEGMGFGASYVCYSGTANPLVDAGLKKAALLGFKRIIVLPYMLFNGVLVKRIYEAADALAQRNPEIEILKAQYLGVEPLVADALLEKAYEGIAGRAHMNCSMCKYRISIVGYENELGKPQQRMHIKTKEVFKPYEMHSIEAESFQIISESRNWDGLSKAEQDVAKRLVHTSGNVDIVDDLFFSAGAVETGTRALLRCRRLVVDVTMVEAGLKRKLLNQLGVETWCGVHDQESELLATEFGITRSAAGIRRAWQKFGNNIVLAIGDAPTALVEAIRLVKEHNWRPQLIIGLPVGFVGTRESKAALKNLMTVPRITNSGTFGGSPWAAACVNVLLIHANDFLAEAVPL